MSIFQSKELIQSTLSVGGGILWLWYLTVENTAWEEGKRGTERSLWKKTKILERYKRKGGTRRGETEWAARKLSQSQPWMVLFLKSSVLAPPHLETPSFIDGSLVGINQPLKSRNPARDQPVCATPEKWGG